MNPLLNKQITLFFIVLIGFSISLCAQKRIGVKAGINLSPTRMQANGIKSQTNMTRFGYHIGGMIEYKLLNSFAVQPELLFIYSTSEYNFNSDYDFEITPSQNTNIQGIISFYELQLPVNLKYYNHIGSINFYLNTGLYLGVIVEGKDNPGNGSKVSLYSSNQNYNRINSGLNFGGGLTFSNFEFGIGYQLGFVDINGNSDASTRLSNILFSLTYFFNRTTSAHVNN